MNEGDVVGERFAIESFAAEGGMAKVYRARDRVTGEIVALKLATETDPHFLERFLREARILATLDHPNVVRHVDSGVDRGVPFLAMQWLDGETLSERLRRGALDASDTVAVLGAIGAGVAHAHGRGLVHRDLKPSNVLLRDGSLSRATVLDFGLARPVSGRTALTQTGLLVGTIGYMSPEQLRDPNSADARSDVFALGCLLYRCLTGRAAYPEREVAVVLGRILFDPPPSVLAIKHDVPPRLAELATRCMSKEPAERPRDAGELLALLEGASRNQANDAVEGRAPSGFKAGITDRERRRGSLVLLAATVPKGMQDDETAIQALCPPSVMEALLAPYEARALPLGSDLAVVLVGGRGVAVDQATDAVRCALALAEAVPHARALVVSGQAEAEGAPVLGELFARAIALDATAPTHGVRVDDLTGNMVGERFQQHVESGVRRVLGERSHGEPSRRLLGRVTPFVGRERELAQLDGLIAEAIAEGAPRVAVVLADPGMGKSRLRAELIGRVRVAREDVRIISGVGDARTTSSPFALARGLLRDLFELRPDDDAAAARARIGFQLAASIPESAAALEPFVGVLAGVPYDEHLGLRSARQSQGDFAHQLRAAFRVTILGAARRRPLLIVLEDAHWADSASLALIDGIPRDAEVAISTIAFARHSLRVEHPTSLTPADVEIALNPLSAKASERVVRAALPSIEDAAAKALVTQSLGNAFFLEELVRAHAGGVGARPDTVITALQTRVEALDPNARRFLRAASVVGEVFWLEAVARITGTSPDALRPLAHALDGAEFVVPRATSRYPAATELRFRHALVRDAAYAMLPDADRRLGHRLLAQWLEAEGELDARMLAEHWEAAGEPLVAAAWFERAAEQALAANELTLAIRLARRAAGDDDRSAAAALVEAEAECEVANDIEFARRRATRATELYPVGVPNWYRASYVVLSSSVRLGDLQTARSTAEALLSAPLAADGIDERMSLARSAHAMSPLQDQDMIRRLVERCAYPSEGMQRDPVLDALREIAGGLGQLASDRLGDILREFRRMAVLFESVGQPRRSLVARLNFGYNLNIAGSFDEALRTLESVRERTHTFDHLRVERGAESNIAVSLLALGRPDEALPHAVRARDYFVRIREPRFAGSCNGYVARVQVALGRLDEARVAVDEALTYVDAFRATHALTLGTLSVVMLAQGDARGALKAARAGFALLDGVVGIHEDAHLRDALVRSLLANGEREEALRVAEQLFLHYRARYDTLDEEMRAAFRAAPFHRTMADWVTELSGRTASYDDGILAG